MKPKTSASKLFKNPKPMSDSQVQKHIYTMYRTSDIKELVQSALDVLSDMLESDNMKERFDAAKEVLKYTLSTKTENKTQSVNISVAGISEETLGNFYKQFGIDPSTQANVNQIGQICDTPAIAKLPPPAPESELVKVPLTFKDMDDIE